MTLSNLIELDSKVYMNTFGARTPVTFVRGEGTTLYDSQGKAYHDFFAGIAVNSLGYNHPALNAALLTQIQSGILHTSNVFYTEPQTILAKLLVDNTAFDRVFFTNSGTEAVEGALKLARKYYFERGEERSRVISAKGSFHGRTLAAVAATGQPKYQAPYGSLLPGTIENVPYNNIAALIEATAQGDVCAILLECIQGEGGILPADPAYLKAVRALCDEREVLLILDEIQTGIGRTGTLLCHEQYGIVPDIITVAKALGGGVPIGAIMAREQVAQAFHPGDHGGTFGGNALACSAGCAVMETILSEGLCAHAAAMGEKLTTALRALSQTHPAVEQVRGMGLLIGVQLSESHAVRDVQLALLERGFVTGTAGNNTLRLAPPLIIGQKPIDALIEALTDLLH